MRGLVMLAMLVGCDPAADDVPTGPADDTDAEDTDTTPVVTEPNATLPPLELCINEFMPGNVVSYEVDGLYPDWIELHNPGNTEVSLDGWTLTDDAEDPRRHELEAPLSVPAGGYLVLYADGQPDLGPTHLSFALDLDGEVVGLFAPDGRGSVVDYQQMVDDIAAARETDCCEGAECWTFVFQGTPGTSNLVDAGTTKD